MGHTIIDFTHFNFVQTVGELQDKLPQMGQLIQTKFERKKPI